MAPASASLLPTSTSSNVAATKRPVSASDAAVSNAEATLLPQDGAASKNNQSIPKPQPQLECPRCKSGNTKFCYYNNYSTTQPRHFCRACRRYWTHGGTLRNVPVGGACRRGSGGNKRRRAETPSTEPSPSTGSPAEDVCLPDMLPATPPFFPFLSDGAFLPQFDLGLGGAATLAGFPWTPAAGSGTDVYDGLAAQFGGGDGTFAGAAWDDFTGIELTWPLPAGN